MSVRTMARVWEFSQHGGTHLLMLLAIADFADDAGNAYPAVSTLANKCRMKPRNAQILLAALRESGELQVRQNEGPKGSNRYRIVLPLGVQSVAGVQGFAGVQEIAPRGAKHCAKPLQGNAYKPSVNHQEPPVREEPTVLVPEPSTREPVAVPGERLPACPTERLIEAYHRHLPMLPRVEVMNDGRRRTLAARWREVITDKDIAKSPDPRAAAIEFFDWYFGHASRSAFLTGRSKDWRADFDFLTTASKFAKVVEGHYHKERSAAPDWTKSAI